MQFNKQASLRALPCVVMSLYGRMKVPVEKAECRSRSMGDRLHMRDCFLVKATNSSATMMPNADIQLPYAGAYERLLVDNVENRAHLRELLEAMFEKLPAPK